MTPKNTTLSLLLLAQLAVIAFVYWPGKNQAAPETDFFSDLNPEQVEGLTITDEENNSMSLDLRAGKWHINEGGYPANTETIQSLLKKVISLQSARLVTTTQSSHARLKVSADLYNRKVDLRLKDGSVKAFFLGSSPSSKTIHFRLADENNVFLVKDLAVWEMQTDKESWWQTTYVSVPKDDLNAVKITNSHGTLSFQKGEDKGWTLAEAGGDQHLSEAEVQNLLGSISKISVNKYLAKEKPESIGSPVCTIEYTTPAESFSLSIWSKDEDGEIYTAKASNQDFYVTAQAFTLKDLLDAQLDAFIAEPEPASENFPQGELEPQPADN